MSTQDKDRGLYRKYEVRRINDPAGKHDDCQYFVLDPRHDWIARQVLRLYAQLAEDAYPQLASDLRYWVELEEASE